MLAKKVDIFWLDSVSKNNQQVYGESCVQGILTVNNVEKITSKSRGVDFPNFGISAYKKTKTRT